MPLLLLFTRMLGFQLVHSLVLSLLPLLMGLTALAALPGQLLEILQWALP